MSHSKTCNLFVTIYHGVVTGKNVPLTQRSQVDLHGNSNHCKRVIEMRCKAHQHAIAVINRPLDNTPAGCREVRAVCMRGNEVDSATLRILLCDERPSRILASAVVLFPDSNPKERSCVQNRLRRMEHSSWRCKKRFAKPMINGCLTQWQSRQPTHASRKSLILQRA